MKRKLAQVKTGENELGTKEGKSERMGEKRDEDREEGGGKKGRK